MYVRLIRNDTQQNPTDLSSQPSLISYATDDQNYHRMILRQWDRHRPQLSRRWHLKRDHQDHNFNLIL